MESLSVCPYCGVNVWGCPLDHFCRQSARRETYRVGRTVVTRATGDAGLALLTDCRAERDEPTEADDPDFIPGPF